MSCLSRQVHRTIRRRRLFAAGDRVAVALSGGPDSVALVWLLRDLQARVPWQVAGLIHVNHGIRGADADEDETFCRSLAARVELPIDVVGVDVPARRRRQSLEAAARTERYAAFEPAAVRLGATAVATGHTQDDQAETVLLRLLRGAGSRGVSAIRPRRGLYARPLIDTRRADVLGYLEARGEPFRQDASNLDLSVPRNRLRHTIMPLIAEAWPGGAAALARFAELAADDELFLERTAAEVMSALAMSGSETGEVIDVRGLRQLPPALARRVVRAAIEAAGGTPALRDVEAVQRLAARIGKPHGHLDLPCLEVDRRGPALRFVGRASARRGVRHPFEYELELPGEVLIRETGTLIRASFKTGRSWPVMPAREAPIALLQAGAVVGPLVVRSRRPGDRLHPFGAPGTRKLQDILVDRKVPREDRDGLPVVADARGRIVWVVGVTIAEECRVTAPEAGVIVLETGKGSP